MAPGVSKYVSDKTTSYPQPGNAFTHPTREQLASQARIGPTDLKFLKSQGLPSAMPPPATAVPQRNPKSITPAAKDAFGTEYDGSTEKSVVLVEDSQVRDFGNDSEGLTSSDSDGHQGFDEERQFSQEHEFHGLQVTDEKMRLRMQQQQHHRHVLDSNSNGYPTTTSGQIDQDDVNEAFGYGNQSSEGEEEGEDDSEEDSDQDQTPNKAIYAATQQSQPHRNASPQVGAQAPPRMVFGASQAHPGPTQNLSVRGTAKPPGGVPPNVHHNPAPPTHHTAISTHAQSQDMTGKRSNGHKTRALPQNQNLWQQGQQMLHSVEEHQALQGNPPANPSKRAKSHTHQNTQSKQQAPTAAFHSANQPIHQSTQSLKSSLEDEIPLDYTTQDLEKMPYSELQKESFDRDPKAHPLQFNTELRESLTDSLPIVRSLTSDDKARFFASLNLTQWEDTGDWFLGQLSQTVNNIRDARKQRRALAASFESEVFRRHQNVESRKRNLEQVLIDMKSNGIGVLGRASSNPPKKMREE